MTFLLKLQVVKKMRKETMKSLTQTGHFTNHSPICQNSDKKIQYKKLYLNLRTKFKIFNLIIHNEKLCALNQVG